MPAIEDHVALRKPPLPVMVTASSAGASLTITGYLFNLFG
jgi:hypothetical protein